MSIRSVRFKLTLLYVGTVAVLLAVFVGVDMVGLRHNLMSQVSAGALTEDAMHEAWKHAITSHVLLALGLVVVIFALGHVFIRRAFRPVRQMTRTARAISEQNLSARVDARGDESEIGELADTLNDMIARLETSFDRTRRFSADAAHELSTPLATLRGEIEIALRRERTSEQYRQILGNLLHQVDRVCAIVDNLLFLSRVDAGQGLPSREEVNLDDVLLAAHEHFEAQARERGLTLRLERVDPVPVSGYREMLRLMIDNLLSNALKFTEPGGEVTVTLAGTKDGFELVISDTGVGIPPRDRTRVFDRFYRVDRSRSKATGGVGLGLSIVREVADAHGIVIQLESDPETGTRVALTGQART